LVTRVSFFFPKLFFGFPGQSQKKQKKKYQGRKKKPFPGGTGRKKGAKRSKKGTGAPPTPPGFSLLGKKRGPPRGPPHPVESERGGPRGARGGNIFFPPGWAGPQPEKKKNQGGGGTDIFPGGPQPTARNPSHPPSKLAVPASRIKKKKVEGKKKKNPNKKKKKKPNSAKS